MSNSIPQITVTHPNDTNETSIQIGNIVGITVFIVLGLIIGVLIKKFLLKKGNFFLAFVIGLITIEGILYATNTLVHWWSIGSILLPLRLTIL